MKDRSKAPKPQRAWWTFSRTSSSWAQLIISRVLLAAIGVVVKSVVAQAQSVGIPPAYGATLPAALNPSSFCKNHTLTGTEFMGLIKVTINHGDLTDVTFIEKTLGAKFTLSYFDTLPNGKPDTQALMYQTNQILSSPITDTLWVYATRIRQLKSGRIALMSLDSQSFPDPNMNVMRNCLHIPISTFYSFFGGNFFGGVINGRGAATKEFVGVGENHSRMSLNIGYNPDDNIVNHIGIDQRP